MKYYPPYENTINLHLNNT
jgi:hypothetical protein